MKIFKDDIMCSTFKYKNCMGRNFDYEVSYQEELRIIDKEEFCNTYAVIGMCTGIVKDYPLLYDGMNSEGLCCSALAFIGNAVYNNPRTETKDIEKGIYNIPSFDIVFYILSEHKSVNEVLEKLPFLNISNLQYSEDFPNSDLHWFICDKKQSIIIEQTSDGLNWYNGDVMTNNPPYNDMKYVYDNCKDIIGVESKKQVGNKYYTRGTETLGLDGDYTSEGRFFRLSYLKDKLIQTNNNFNNIAQSFHLLSSVEQIYGATPIEDKFEYTIYSIVYDMENLTVYLKLYDDLILIQGRI